MTDTLSATPIPQTVETTSTADPRSAGVLVRTNDNPEPGTLAKEIERRNQDPGFRRATIEWAAEMRYQQRQPLCRDAVYAAVQDRDRIERALARGDGVWFNELGPLQPAERGLVIEQLKRMWRINR